MPLGSATPRLATAPARPLTPQTSRGFEVVDFAEQVLGLTLMPWQRHALVHGLELTEQGTFRFRTLLVLCARQQGKSTLLQVLALWRLYVDRAGLVIGTAQNLDVATETWDGAVSMAEGTPDLAAEIAHVSRVNGDKYLRLTTGERYKVTTASRRGARGLSCDLVLLDELREHQDWEAWSAATKTTLSRPSPQVAAFSNAGDSSSVVLRDLRDKALAAFDDPTTTIGLLEWSAPEDANSDDRQAWAQANPALGYYTPEVALVAAHATDPPEVFATECLCQWVTAVQPAFPPGLWGSLADPQAERGADVVFALDVAPDQSTASIAVAWRRQDGAAHVMLAEHGQGTAWVVARAVQLLTRWGGRLVLEQTGAGAYLHPELVRAGLTVEVVARRFYVDACAALDAAATARTVRHGAQSVLTHAAGIARWSSNTSAGQRSLSRKDPAVSPLVAASLALHGLSLAPSLDRGGWMVSLP